MKDLFFNILLILPNDTSSMFFFRFLGPEDYGIKLLSILVIMMMIAIHTLHSIHYRSPLYVNDSKCKSFLTKNTK